MVNLMCPANKTGIEPHARDSHKRIEFGPDPGRTQTKARF